MIYYITGLLLILDQAERAREWVEQRAQELQECAEKMKQQLKYPESRLWVKGLMSRNVGKDVSLLLQDIKHTESTGRRRGTTWGTGGPGSSQENMRRSRNMIGYQVQNQSLEAEESH